MHHGLLTLDAPSSGRIDKTEWSDVAHVGVEDVGNRSNQKIFPSR